MAAALFSDILWIDHYKNVSPSKFQCWQRNRLDVPGNATARPGKNKNHMATTCCFFASVSGVNLSDYQTRPQNFSMYPLHFT